VIAETFDMKGPPSDWTNPPVTVTGVAKVPKGVNGTLIGIERPGQPEGCTAELTEQGMILVRWEPLSSAVTSYVVLANRQGAPRRAVSGRRPITPAEYLIPRHRLVPGAEYTFQVGPVNIDVHGMPSPKSNTVVVPLKLPSNVNADDIPAVVKRVNASVTEKGQIGIIWTTEPKDATSYVILAKANSEARRAITGQITFPAHKPDKMQFEIPKERLWADQVYSFQVLAMKKGIHAKASSPSPPIEVPSTGGKDPSTRVKPLVEGTDTEMPPMQPEAPRGTIETDGHLKLMWHAVKGATGYMIRCIEVDFKGEMKGAKECTGKLEGGSSEITYIMPSNTLEPGSPYRFEILALNAAGDSSPSEPSEIIETALETKTIVSTSAPSQVQGVHSSYTPDGIELNWNALEEASFYQIYYMEVNDRNQHFESEWQPLPDAEEVSETQYQVNTLKKDKEYEFTIAAVNKYGRGPKSDRTEALLFGVHTPWPPEPPEATEVTSNSLLLNWAAGLEDGGLPVTSFRLQLRVWGTDYIGEGIPVGNIDNTRLDRLMPGTKYRFRISARNAVGWSSYGPESENVVTLDDKKRKAETWTAVIIVGLTLLLGMILCFWSHYIWVWIKGPSAEYIQLSSLGHDDLGDEDGMNLPKPETLSESSDDEGGFHISDEHDDDDDVFADEEAAVVRGRSSSYADEPQFASM